MIPRETPNFITQAVDGAAHRGYSTQFRNLDAEIVREIGRNRDWMPLDFVNYLVNRYTRSDLLKAFPAGLG
jgi:hypothetical protein